jgi:putative membrane protein
MARLWTQVWAAGPWADWHPEVLVLLAVLVALYAQLTGPGAQTAAHGKTPTARQRAAFAAALATLYVAMGSPLELLADRYVFTARALQMSLVLLVFPPLFLSSVPASAWERLFAQPGWRRLWAGLTRPAVALAVFAGVFSFFQVPPVVSLALRDNGWYVASTVVLLLVALVAWWPVYGPCLEGERPHGLVQMAYLFLMGFPGLFLTAALVLFSTQPVYAPYAHSDARLGLSAMTDQVVGGIAMQVFFTLVRSWAFAQVALAYAHQENLRERESRRVLELGARQRRREAPHLVVVRGQRENP